MQVREKLLLRQVDLLLHSKCSSSHAFHTEFCTENEDELLKLIRNYGKFDYDSINLAFTDIFKNEDDNDPQIDHETMYKCIEDCAIAQEADQINANEEQIVVDFSTNRRLLRDSIINITVKETKELIEGQQKVEPPAISSLDLSSISPTDTLSTKITDDKSSKSSQTEVPAKKKRSFRPKITINNCNGIINLRNIAQLTINCAKETSIRKEKSSKKDHSNKTEEDEEVTVTSTTKDDIEGNCEFYDRLLNEIKNSLLLKKTRTYQLPLSEEEEETPIDTSNEDVLATPDSTNEDICIEKTANRKLVLKNFENLKIILENVNGTDLNPVQIEQWLAEIVSETEIEPNIGEIFEHSEITS